MDFQGKTFVAFLDISGFKELMKQEKAQIAIDVFYQAGYDVLSSNQDSLAGVFVSDCGIVFASNETDSEFQKLNKLLIAVKSINDVMLEKKFMLKTSIAYGQFNYRDKIELQNIRKNPIIGNAYLNAFLDNDKVECGKCRIISNELPDNIEYEEIPLLKKTKNYYYYYWNLTDNSKIDEFEKSYKDSYQAKFQGILQALKNG